MDRLEIGANARKVERHDRTLKANRLRLRGGGLVGGGDGVGGRCEDCMSYAAARAAASSRGAAAIPGSAAAPTRAAPNGESSCGLDGLAISLVGLSGSLRSSGGGMPNARAALRSSDFRSIARSLRSLCPGGSSSEMSTVASAAFAMSAPLVCDPIVRSLLGGRSSTRTPARPASCVIHICCSSRSSAPNTYSAVGLSSVQWMTIECDGKVGTALRRPRTRRCFLSASRRAAAVDVGLRVAERALLVVDPDEALTIFVEDIHVCVRVLFLQPAVATWLDLYVGCRYDGMICIDASPSGGRTCLLDGAGGSLGALRWREKEGARRSMIDCGGKWALATCRR